MHMDVALSLPSTCNVHTIHGTSMNAMMSALLSALLYGWKYIHERDFKSFSHLLQENRVDLFDENL